MTIPSGWYPRETGKITTSTILIGSDGIPNNTNDIDRILIDSIKGHTIPKGSKAYRSDRELFLPLYGIHHISLHKIWKVIISFADSHVWTRNLGGSNQITFTQWLIILMIQRILSLPFLNFNFSNNKTPEMFWDYLLVYLYWTSWTQCRYLNISVSIQRKILLHS